MAAKKGGAKGKDKKGPKVKAPGKPRNLFKSYEIQGDSITKKNKTCPKCGAGSFLAQHKGRVSCGKCNYTEFQSSKPASEEKAEEVKA